MLYHAYTTYPVLLPAQTHTHTHTHSCIGMYVVFPAHKLLFHIGKVKCRYYRMDRPFHISYGNEHDNIIEVLSQIYYLQYSVLQLLYIYILYCDKTSARMSVNDKSLPHSDTLPSILLIYPFPISIIY